MGEVQPVPYSERGTEAVKVFRVHARGYVKAFAHPTTICQRVVLFARGYRRNWIGPCWGNGIGLPLSRSGEQK
jgi:hypothetical protein